MLRLAQVDLDDIAQALSDQTDYEHRWLLDPATGELHIWSSDTALDAQDLEDGDEFEETDLVVIDPLPSYVWYRDMADFAERISDDQASRRLERAIRGRGRFAGSGMSCSRSTRIWCRSIRGFVTCGRGAARSSGCWTRGWSTRAKLSGTWRSMRTLSCPESSLGSPGSAERGHGRGASGCGVVEGLGQ